MTQARPRWIAALLLAILLGVGSWWLRIRMPAGPPNLLLIVVDTLRADHLHCYGASRAASPTLDELARGGLRFDRAYAPASWTLPSVTSYLSGQQPGRHGVFHPGATVPAELPWLPSYLQARSLTTVALIGNSNITEEHGFSRGFDLFLEARKEPKLWKNGLALYPAAEDLTNLAMEALDKLKDSSFFLYVHYMDTHAPYLLPKGAEDPFAAPDYQGFLVTRLEKVKPFVGPRFVRVHPFFWSKFREVKEDYERVRSLYDAKLRYADQQIGRLLAHLDQLELRKNTYIVFTADHGEGLFEHGIREHEGPPYEHQVHVPLIMSGPRLTSKVVEAPVELVDLPGALSSLLLPDEPEVFPADAGNGVLSQVLQGEDPSDSSQASVVAASYSLGDKPDARMVRLNNFKMMEFEDERALYDLENDPRELNNLAKEEPKIVDELQAILEHRLAPFPKDNAEDDAKDAPDQETLDRLRALGYIK